MGWPVMRETAGGDEEVGIEPSAAVAAALGELRTGLAGAATVALLQRLGRQCVRSARTSFPPPEGYDRWSDDAVDHLLADMFAREDNDRPGEGHKAATLCAYCASASARHGWWRGKAIWTWGWDPPYRPNVAGGPLH